MTGYALRWGNSGFFGQPDEVRDRAHAQLFHHPATVDLDRLLDRSQIAGDLLVEPAGDDVGHDLALARRQDRQSGH